MSEVASKAEGNLMNPVRKRIAVKAGDDGIVYLSRADSAPLGTHRCSKMEKGFQPKRQIAMVLLYLLEQKCYSCK